jgi:hypothetical protein
MGLIRKSLMVGTAGVVSGSSKKQRVAAATAANTAQTNLLLKQQADAENAFRYATDPVYRTYIDAQKAAAAKAAAEAAARRAAQTKQMVDASMAAVTYISLAVAFAVLGVFVWSIQALTSTVRKQPRHLWKQDALSAAWRSAKS